MNARLSRLAGALLLEHGEEYFLIGNTKQPCDFPAEGFDPPAAIDALERPVLPLRARRTIQLQAPRLCFELGPGARGEACAANLAERLLIARNGSVSDRLWRLLLNPAEPENEPDAEEIAASWLMDMPKPIWDIVRDTVLRCL